MFKDVLHVLISEGADVSIPLEAQGTGSTLICPELGTGPSGGAGPLEFGHQFVGRSFTRDITVHNMGRRQLLLLWTNDRFEEVKKVYGKAARASGKKFELSMCPAEEQPVFTITPEKVRNACSSACAHPPALWQGWRPAQHQRRRTCEL